MNYGDATIALAITMGLTEVIKKTGLPSKYSPLVSLIFGLTTSYIADPSGSLAIITWSGLIVGLSASGLYSGAKKITE
jgi:hypothetical protein